MSDLEFYVLWATPLLAVIVNRGCANYAAFIMLMTLLFDQGTKPFSDDAYFLAAASLDLICIWAVVQMRYFFVISMSLNLYQFLAGSIYQMTGNFIHFYVIILLQVAFLCRVRGIDVGIFGDSNKGFDSFKPAIFGRNGGMPWTF
jgi:hypothetical protein